MTMHVNKIFNQLLYKDKKNLKIQFVFLSLQGLTFKIILLSLKQNVCAMFIKLICVPESFKISILYQFLYYKITFVNDKHTQTNLKGYFKVKTGFK